MRVERWAGLNVRVTGGLDREGGGEGPVVVLLHGYGAPGDDLVPLWRVLQVPREVRFVFPEAPLDLPELGPLGARAWWRLTFETGPDGGVVVRDRSSEVPEGLAAANDHVVQVLDAVERELGADSSRIVLGGFSQGAMVSCDVALRSDRKLAGLVLLSGTLLAQQQWQPLMSARSGLPVLQSHGRQDPLLAFDAAVRLRDLWRQAGADVRWIEFNGGHEIPGSVLEALGEFIDTHT